MPITIDQAVVGTRVRAYIAFSGVPKHTEGVIDEDYGSGVTVAWDLPHCPLPDGYLRFDARRVHPPRGHTLLRDGFNKEHELHLLDLVV